MCFLPLCHIAERLGGEYFALYTGAMLNFVENPETVPENVREIAPTVFTAVPRVWEKFYSGVMIGAEGGQRAAAGRLCLGASAWARRSPTRCWPAQPVDGCAQAASSPLARWLALDNVRKMIGIHRARFLVTGAAPISPELVKWYLALGVPMLEVWGMTETCGAATGVPADAHQARLDRPGRQLQRGQARPGHRRDPGARAQRVHGLPEPAGEDAPRPSTPTAGCTPATSAWWTTDGFFRITDRMKDIIITAGGKNITPSELENELKFSPYITDAVVIGDKQALPHGDHHDRPGERREVRAGPRRALLQLRQPDQARREVQALIQAEIDRVNSKFARVEQIKKFFLLDTQLSAEDEELTPTMKLKRKLVQQKYAPQIEAMYRCNCAIAHAVLVPSSLSDLIPLQGDDR